MNFGKYLCNQQYVPIIMNIKLILVIESGHLVKTF